MSKTKTKTKSKRRKNKAKPLNPKTKSHINISRFFQYSEGRLTKDDIISLSNIDTYYRLVGNGYIKLIKNADNSNYEMTSKFKNWIRSNIDGKVKFSGTGSTVHAKTVKEIMVNVIPKSVVSEGRVKTETEIKEEFKKLKRTDEYKEKVNDMKQNIINDKANLTKEHNKIIDDLNKQKDNIQDRLATETSSDLIKSLKENLQEVNNKIVQENVNYKSDINKKDLQLKVLDDKHRGISPNDFSIKCSREEAEEIIDNLRTQRELVKDKYKEYYDRAIEKVDRIITHSSGKEIELNVEAITHSYSEDRIQAKENYSQVVDKDIIYIPANQ